MPTAAPPRRRYQVGAPPFRPDKIAEGWKPPSAFKKSNVLQRYCHRKKRKEVDPHYQKYYQGRVSTEITDVLKPNIPGNPFNEPVFFPHKATDVTELHEKAGKLPRRPATAPDYTYGSKCTDVTEIYRHIPPGRTSKQFPYFGARASAVTDPARYVDTSGLPLLSWWENPPLVRRMPLPRPVTAPEVVYPQHVSPELLYQQIRERALRRQPQQSPLILKEKPSTPPEPPPLSARSVRSEVPVSEAVTPRSPPASVRSHASAKSDGSRRSVKSQKSDASKAETGSTSTKQPAPSECNTARNVKSLQAPPSRAPSSKAPSHVSKASDGDKAPASPVPSAGAAAKPPRNPKHRRPKPESTTLSGLPGLRAETLDKEKLDRVTKWAGELQTWAIPEEARRPPKPVYEERDHSRKKTDVTAGVYIW